MNIKFVSLFLATLAIATNAAPMANSDWTHFHHVTYYGNYESLQTLVATAKQLNSKFNINHRSKSGQGNTPLHLAVMQGHLQCVQFLLDNKADINAQNDNNDTPLHLAVYRGQLACVQILVQHQASLTIRNSEHETPAMLAAEKGHNEIVKFFTELQAEQKYQEILTDFKNLPFEETE
ncbi:ankyrin repeat domain-containing protein [bacterium]|nr:MAG: ankyrin repeat domain-containing protein [bacterium]